MPGKMTTRELEDSLDRFLTDRCKGIDPAVPNLRFCPIPESCDGPARHVVFRVHTYPWMANPMNVTHGGIIASILDSSMGILCGTLYGLMTPTITMTTNYCHPVPLDANVMVAVRVTFAGGTSAQTAAEMYLPGESGDPLATATGVYYTAHAQRHSE